MEDAMTFPDDVIHSLTQRDEQFESLTHFFDEMHRIWPSTDPLTSLEQFLSEFHRLHQLLVEPATPLPEVLPDRDALVAFCHDFGSKYEELQRAGEFIDVWTVAGLSRDELRHASILAWFLNPLGTHGFGASIFEKWVSKLHFASESRLIDLSDWHGDYRVATEVYPSDDGGDRVDIEIDGKDFYLCVEVKIDAPEGENQLARYLEVAQKKAASRPFTVVYLTPERAARKSTDNPFVVAATWEEFANSLRGLSRTKSGFPDRLITQFLKRVENF
jgi:hypothetical protein